MVFCTHDLLGESYSCVTGFAAAAAATPLTCVSLGSLPIQRVQLLCHSCDTAAGAAKKELTSIAHSTTHLLALQVDGTFFEMLLQPELLQNPLSRSLLLDRKLHSQAAGDACRVFAGTTAPVAISSGSGYRTHSSFLTTAYAEGGPVTAAILGELGVFQLWLLAENTEKPGLSTAWSSPPESLTLEFFWYVRSRNWLALAASRVVRQRS